MARQVFTNNAFSTLSGSILAGDLALSVQAGAGALFPSLSGGDWFICTLVDASNNIEIIKVTARTVDAFTIVRAQEGTSALPFASGDRIALRLTANTLTLLAPLASPTFTGVPLSTTPAVDDNSTKIATTAFVQQEITDAIAAIPAAPTIAYIKVSHQETNNTSGGGLTAATWNVRTINTEDSDAGSHCSIATNQITLAAGTYWCRIRCPVMSVDQHQAKLYNVTDAADVIMGTSGYSNGMGLYGESVSEITGRFVVAAPKVFEVRHIINGVQPGAAQYGGGYPANQGNTEVYTTAEFWKVA